MASYTAGTVGVHDKQLVASTVDTVTFNTSEGQVEVLSDGAAAVYFTVDGSAPTVSGGHTRKLVSGVTNSQTVSAPDYAPFTVKLISAGTPVYDVTAV